MFTASWVSWLYMHAWVSIAIATELHQAGICIIQSSCSSYIDEDVKFKLVKTENNNLHGIATLKFNLVVVLMLLVVQ